MTKDFSEITFPIRKNDTLPAGNFGYPENLVEDILQVWGKFGKGVRLILNSTLYLGASPDFRSKVPTHPLSHTPIPSTKQSVAGRTEGQWQFGSLIFTISENQT